MIMSRPVMPRSGRRSGRFAPLAALSHRFAVGDAVSLAHDPGSNAPRGQRFRVLAALPARDTAFQYRIRGEAETYDRMAPENMLKPASPPADAVFSRT